MAYCAHGPKVIAAWPTQLGGAASTPLPAASTLLGLHGDDERQRGNLPGMVVGARAHRRALALVRARDVTSTVVVDGGKDPAEVRG
jgi:hypothetical protein